MRKLRWCCWIFLVSTHLSADFLFEHRLNIANHSYLLVIMLPDYFSHHFGIGDEVDYAIHEQLLGPPPNETIATWKTFLQEQLWNGFETSPFRKGGSLREPRFDRFR